MPLFARISFATRVCTTCALPEGSPAWTRGDKCVVEMEYGLDVGTHMSMVDDAPGVPAAGGGRVPRILRKATAQDLARVLENDGLAATASQRFVSLLAEGGVFVKPLSSGYTLGRERLLIIFGAPDHIDCRRVVGKMQWDLKTRIEVRHVGVRDEAAVAGGIGPCGRPLCCATWLRNFRSVNVRMVKAQELSLNPTAINGCCGRLKCCLRYEYDVYLEASKDLPEAGTVVRWPENEGVVVSRDVLQRKLLVRTRDEGLRHVAAADVTVVAKTDPPLAAKEEKHEDPTGEWAKPGASREA
ncbi:MAG: regulatory iron-sulfur-containing complex subunit RicT [bacterium]